MQRPIGNSGLTVNAIGLGAMPLSIDGRPDESRAINVIHRALDCGMTLIDTADVYCLNQDDIGHNERLIAKALRFWNGDKDKLVIATKGGLLRPQGDWIRNADPKHLQSACEASLRALSVESIQLYQLHAPDPQISFEASVEQLAKLQEQGKVQHIGLSNVTVEEIEQARNIVPIVSVQNRCNPSDLSAFEMGIVDYCTENNIAMIPYSPVGGRFGKGLVEENTALREVAKIYNLHPFQMALAWLLAKSPVMIPIPGATRLESVESSAAVMDANIEQEHVKQLDDAFGL